MEDEIDVFIFTDSEDRITATTQIPKAQRDEFAFLEVKDVTPHGAFLNWGLEKDLFVPFREQLSRMRIGQKYVVFIYLDDRTKRLVASSKIKKFLDQKAIDLEKGDKVNLLILNNTDLGMNVIINDLYSGLIFKEDLHTNLKTGDKTVGYIKNLRPDNKIDVVLHRPGYMAIEPNAQRVLLKIRQNNGYLGLTDISNPQEIKDQLNISKKAFKKAIGSLYKKHLIQITDRGIYLVEESK